MNRWLGLGLLLIVAGALALRTPQLGLRPMHNDEGVNAVLVQKLWQDGTYKYNPDEYHGPSLYYATLPFLWLSGARDITQVSDSTLRWVAVFFGTAMILLLLLFIDGLGAATLAAGILMALSPAMVFYSRYFIHEMLLVCFTMLVLGAAWRYSRTRHGGWAITCGLGVGLMYATKETFVIPLLAIMLAGGLTVVWIRATQETVVRDPFYWNFKHTMAGFLCAGLVSVVLFTSCFTDAAGPLNSIISYMPWLKRAGGESPHIHPPWFYFERLFWFHAPKGPFWTEGSILILAIVGIIAAFTRIGLGNIHPGLARFLAIYTVLQTVVYSAISYKTPWCMLGFLQGMILMAGIGVVALFSFVNSWRSRTALTLLLIAAAAHLGWQALRASYGVTPDHKIFAADRRNPYVYSQTVPNILELVERVQAISKVHPDGPKMLVKVMSPGHDYWPLPWYFRGFKQIGFWGEMPKDPYAPVMIVSSQFEAELDEKSEKKWLSVGLYELRPSPPAREGQRTRKLFFELYVQFDLWKKFIETQPRAKDE